MSDWTVLSGCPWKHCRRRPHSWLHCPTERCTEAGLCPSLHANKRIICKWAARKIPRQPAAHHLMQCCVLNAKLWKRFHMPVSLLVSHIVTCKVPVACISEGVSVQPGLTPQALSEHCCTIQSEASVKGRQSAKFHNTFVLVY